MWRSSSPPSTTISIPDVYKRQVVNPTRQDAITRGTLSNDDFDGEMDDASYHIESIEEKELPIDPINAYNHMAIYLRWCMEHDLRCV